MVCAGSPKQGNRGVLDAYPTNINELLVTRTLGRGYFGEVCRAQEKAGSKRMFAIKKIKQALIEKHKFQHQIHREMSIMYSLNHPRIVKLFFNFEDSRYLYLGMEFVTGGTLYDKLQRARRFPADVASRYFAETCDALQYIHHLPEKVIHRDIKPENILLDAKDHVKLADFGWANILQDQLRDTFCGTLDYLAPEMVEGTGHDESVDLWSMGVLLFELLAGHSPFGAGSREGTFQAILSDDVTFPPSFDADARDLVSRLCRKLPAERLTVDEALAHAFVASRRPTPSKPIAPSSPAAAASGPTSSGAEDARASDVVRQLLEEQAKAEAEIQALLEAKRLTEEALLEVNTELDEAHRELQRERRDRVKEEAGCAELKKLIATRERELRRAQLRQANSTGRCRTTERSSWMFQGPAQKRGSKVC